MSQSVTIQYIACIALENVNSLYSGLVLSDFSHSLQSIKFVELVTN